jgi:hypothetical protein
MGGMAFVSTPSIRNLMYHRIVARLDVDIAGPPLQRRENRGVDQADDRAHVRARGRRQLVDGNGLVVPGFVLADHVERESFARVFQHALGLLGLLQDVGDLLQGRNFGDDALAEQQADLVDHHQLAGIGNGNRQAPVGRLFQGHELIAEHQVHRDLLEQIVVQLEVAQIDEFATITPRDIPRALEFVGNRRRFRHQFPAIPPFTSTVFLSAMPIPVYNPSKSQFLLLAVWCGRDGQAPFFTITWACCL